MVQWHVVVVQMLFSNRSHCVQLSTRLFFLSLYLYIFQNAIIRLVNHLPNP